MEPRARRSVSVRMLVVLLALAVVVGAVAGVAISRSTTSSSSARSTDGAGPASPPASAAAPGSPAEPSTGSTTTGPGAAGPATTGVPSGTALTAYTGPSTITTAGTVIDAKTVTSCLVIKADNVTIKNSLISASCYFDVLSDNGNTGLTITDVEIDGRNNTSSDSAVNGGGYTCLRCNIHGTIDGFKAGTGVTIKDSWIHDLAMTAGAHNDGVQSLGTTSLRITGNTIVLADGATSAVILSTGSASAMRNVTIADNLLGGGAFTVYGGYQAGSDTRSKVSAIVITGNRFSTKIHPRSGAYGPLASTDAPVTVAGNTWSDGPDAGKPVT